jgi:predicted Fe-Mo cluster-binding NifX family protein
MKIAIPSEYGYVNQHFGRSREFTVVELDNGKIVSQKIISADNLQHNHAGLAGLMQNEGIEVVIVGGIGAKALEALEESGLRVVSGANGKIEEVVGSFARGELVSSAQGCCHHHGEHHGHGCHHG